MGMTVPAGETGNAEGQHRYRRCDRPFEEEALQDRDVALGFATAGLPAVALGARETARLRQGSGGQPSPESRAKAGGEEGIRTPGSLSTSTVFKTAALNHSATSPAFWLRPSL